MRKLVLYLVWGWFFYTQSPYGPQSEATVLQQVGPFTTEAECKQEAAKVEDMVQALGIPGVKMSRCIYQQET